MDAKISATCAKSGTDLPKGMTVVPLSTVPTSPEQVTGSSTLTPVEIKPENTTNVVIAFKWDYDDASGSGSNDGEDTEKGKAAGTLDLGTLKITATQVD